MDDGVILDPRFASALADHFICDGIIKRKQGVAVKRPPAELLQRCWLSILVHGTAHIYTMEENVGGATAEALSELGLAKVHKGDRFRLPIFTGDNPTPDQLLHHIVNIRRGKPFITKYLYERIGKIIRDDKHLVAKLGPGLSSWTSQRVRAMVGQLPELLFRHFSGEYLEFLLLEQEEDYLPEKYVGLPPARVSQDTAAWLSTVCGIDSIMGIEKSAWSQSMMLLVNRVYMILAAAEASGMPVLTDRVYWPTPSRRLALDSDSSVSVVTLAMSKAGLDLPVVNNSRELLTLIHDNRFKQLQEIVREMRTNLMSGNFDEVVYLQKKVDEAGREWEGISRMRRRMQWMLAFSLVIGAAEAAVGLPPIFSMPLAASHLGLERWQMKREQKCKWLWLFPKVMQTH